MKEQARNRRNNRLDTVKITAFGEIKSLQDWLDDERCKVSAGTTICYRIGAGWKPEDAISKPSERS
jgi:putative component of toxin-antitoxin plasmid stabilization module